MPTSCQWSGLTRDVCSSRDQSQTAQFVYFGSFVVASVCALLRSAPLKSTPIKLASLKVPPSNRARLNDAPTNDAPSNLDLLNREAEKSTSSHRAEERAPRSSAVLAPALICTPEY